MTVDEMKRAFKAEISEYGHFPRIEKPRSTRPDLHAFQLLDELVPGTRDIVSSTGHDEIWLSIEPALLAEAITAGQVQELVRCGVRYDADHDALCMFV